MQGGSAPFETAAFLCFAAIALPVALTVLVCYVRTLQMALRRISPRNRRMAPDLVWLLMVPCVHFVMQFVVAVRLPDSLQNEFRERGQDAGGDYGKHLGGSCAALNIMVVAVARLADSVVPDDPALSAIACVLAFLYAVLALAFWVKIARYSARIAVCSNARSVEEPQLRADEVAGP
jgi:hypothetical protein